MAKKRAPSAAAKRYREELKEKAKVNLRRELDAQGLKELGPGEVPVPGPGEVPPARPPVPPAKPHATSGSRSPIPRPVEGHGADLRPPAPRKPSDEGLGLPIGPPKAPEPGLIHPPKFAIPRFGPELLPPARADDGRPRKAGPRWRPRGSSAADGGELRPRPGAPSGILQGLPAFIPGGEYGIAAMGLMGPDALREAFGGTILPPRTRQPPAPTVGAGRPGNPLDPWGIGGYPFGLMGSRPRQPPATEGDRQAARDAVGLGHVPEGMSPGDVPAGQGYGLRLRPIRFPQAPSADSPVANARPSAGLYDTAGGLVGLEVPPGRVRLPGPLGLPGPVVADAPRVPAGSPRFLRPGVDPRRSPGDDRPLSPSLDDIRAEQLDGLRDAVKPFAPRRGGAEGPRLLTPRGRDDTLEERRARELESLRLRVMTEDDRSRGIGINRPKVPAATAPATSPDDSAAIMKEAVDSLRSEVKMVRMMVGNLRQSDRAAPVNRSAQPGPFMGHFQPAYFSGNFRM